MWICCHRAQRFSSCMGNGKNSITSYMPDTLLWKLTRKPLETILAKSLTEARPQLQWFSIPFHASKSKILREDTTKKVRIMKTKEQVQEQCPELFKGIGWFPGEPYHIHTNPSITPKQTPCRPIPVHLKQTFQQEIEKMLTTWVIKPSLKQLHG